MQVKRTYGSRRNNSSSSSTTGLTASAPPSRKRTAAEVLTSTHNNIPTSLKRRRTTVKPKQQKTLTQLHFTIDQTTLRACQFCHLTYTKGAPEDEALHRAHCLRVQKGMEWGREEERESTKAGVIQIACQVKLKDGQRGRIISCPAECMGKIGSKITALLETINLSLSSPPLTQECLRDAKIYLFLLKQPSTTSGSSREKIVGCVIAQRISSAMAVAVIDRDETVGDPAPNLVAVDCASGLFCHPELLATPMGIPRLFVSSTCRRQGIASALLTAAATTFIHGCPLDPRQGQVAFTQPTGDGKALMTKWGAGGVRIYEE